MARKNEFKKDKNTSNKNLYFRNYYRKNIEKLREYNRKKKKQYYLRDSILKIQMEENKCQINLRK